MKLLYTVLLVFSISAVFAQTPASVAEPGKLVFTEVVPADSLTKKALYENLFIWLTKNNFRMEQTDSLAGSLVGIKEFPVYARGYITQKVHGKIKYKALLEVKDYKYKFTFSDFTFIYYKEDRNRNMVPTSKTKALEDEKAAGWQSLWEHHQQETQEIISETITGLKAAVTTAIEKNKIVADNKKKPAIDW